MSLLDVVVVIVALLSVADAAIVFLPKSWLKQWFNFLSKNIKGRKSWFIPTTILIVFFIFLAFFLQAETFLELVPGIFLGGVLMKFIMVGDYPEETIPMIKKITNKKVLLTITADLVLVAAIILALIIK